jgi:hypothetical protein
MSRIICKTHGRQGVVEFCRHLYNVIRKQEKYVHQDDFKEIKVSYEDIDPELNDLEDCSVHYFCNQCVKKYGLPVEQPILSGDRDAIYKEVFNNMKLICIKCLEESIVD